MKRENLFKTIKNLNLEQVNKLILFIEEEKISKELQKYLQDCINLSKL